MASEETIAEVEFSEGERAGQWLADAVNTDEREGKLSASSMQQAYHCHGSLRMKRRCKGIDTESSKSGTRVHEGTDTGDTEDLDEVELELVERNQEIVARIDAEREWDSAHNELRLWYRLFDEKLFSAKVDRIWICGDEATIIDYKTGFRWVDNFDPQRDLQLRTGAVVAWKEFGVTKVNTGFFLPRFEKEVWARYELEDLQRAEQQLLEIHEAASHQFAPLVPGAHCQYCPAMAECNAFLSVIPLKGPVFDLAAASGDDLKRWAFVGEMVKRFEPVGKAVREEVRTRLKRGDSLPWARLKAGVPKRKIVNTGLALHRLQGLLPDDEISNCCTVAIGKVEKAVKKWHGFPEKQAKKLVSDNLEDTIELKAPEDSVELDWGEA